MLSTCYLILKKTYSENWKQRNFPAEKAEPCPGWCRWASQREGRAECRHGCGQGKTCPCSSGDMGMQLWRLWSNLDCSTLWLPQGTILPDPAVLHVLRYGYLELAPQRSGLTLRMLTSLLTYMGATKSFLVPLQIRPLIEIPTAGWNADLSHLPWSISKIHCFNFQIVKKKTCLGMYFLLIANCVWSTQFSLIALLTKLETPVIASESKN